MSSENTTPKNCHTCAFQYPCNKNNGKYCTLGNFPILNPDLGCGKHMYKCEFRSNNMKHISPEEKAAYDVAKKNNRFVI